MGSRPEANDAASAASGSTPVERIYFAWNEALTRNDADALLALYSENARFESRWCRICSAPRAECYGRKQLPQLFRILADRKPTVRQYHRTGYLTDGKRLI